MPTVTPGSIFPVRVVTAIGWLASQANVSEGAILAGDAIYTTPWASGASPLSIATAAGSAFGDIIVIASEVAPSAVPKRIFLSMAGTGGAGTYTYIPEVFSGGYWHYLTPTTSGFVSQRSNSGGSPVGFGYNTGTPYSFQMSVGQRGLAHFEPVPGDQIRLTIKWEGVSGTAWVDAKWVLVY